MAFTRVLSCVGSVLFFLFTYLFSFQAHAQSDWIGWPSASDTDGRFMAITGPFSAISYAAPEILIGIPASATTFDIELFDGDAGFQQTTRYDVNFFTSGYTYTLYRDPNRDGSGTDVDLVRIDTDFADDAWDSYVTNHPVNPAAQGAGGFYWYRMELVYNGDPNAEQFFNALKLRVRSDATSSPIVGAFGDIIIGASPINFLLDPPLNSPDNTFDGDWVFNVQVPAGVAPPINFYDSDADFAGDLEGGVGAPNPPDDNDARPDFRISPSIRYELFAPNGELITLNTDPSGNVEEEVFVYDPPVAVPPGFYEWHWFGIDASNVFILRTDFLLIPVPEEIAAAVGNYVWVDENGDGMQDAGEPGLAGVTVILKNAVGDTVGTRVTDADGNYMFNNLPPGEYTVEIDATTLPAGIAQTTNPVLPGADFGNQSLPYTVNLSPGETNLTADFGYIWEDPNGNTGTAALGDRVWADTNGNGIQDPSEPGLAGVELTIYNDSDGNGVIEPGVDSPFTAAVDQNGFTGTGTTTTESDGSYIFSELPNDAYIVVVNPATVPTGYTQTGDPDDFGKLADSPDNQLTTPIVMEPGDDYLNVDFGYQPDTLLDNSIGDTVFLDANANGTQDASELGISEVTIALLDDQGGHVASDVTDENGLYLFDGLADGTYTVQIVDANAILLGLEQSADPDSMLDGMSTVTVSGGIANLDQDFGYVPDGHQTGDGLLGDTIFFDRNGNGLPDDGEGIGFVTVELYDVTGSSLLDVTQTALNGKYYFGSIADIAASYTVRVDITTLPAGLTNSVDPDGGNDSESVINLGADPDGVNDGINLDQDFGYVNAAASAGSIGDLVWLDADADGVNDGLLGPDGLAGTSDDEPGIEGVTLDLYYDFNADGDIDAGDPRIATTVTDVSGAYLFDQLPAGSYVVDVTDQANRLAGYWHSLGAADTNDNSQSDPYAVSLSEGENIVTADFGYYVELASIGDFVWFDANANGIQDAGEPGLQGIEVTLTIDYQNGDQTVLTTLTDNLGIYSFDNLLADEDYDGDGSSDEPVFTITVTTPTGLVSSPIDVGSDDNIDSDNPAGELADTIPGQNDDSNDFGYYDLGSISGNVSEDTDRDGTIDGPLPGVTVELFVDETGPLGVPDGFPDSATALQTTTTGPTGDYTFDNVAAGNYVVVQTNLPGYDSLSDGDTTIDNPSGGDLSNPDTLDDIIPVTVLVDPTAADPTMAAEDDDGNDFVDSQQLVGLGDLVWFDHNADGVQDLPSEIGASGIVVNLLDSGGAPLDTTTTDGTGFYEFTGLVAGTYMVEVDPASFTTAVQQTYDLDDGVTTTPASPNKATVSLTPGETNNDVDFGYRPLGTIGDTVWNDLDASGDINGSETGIAGVTVTLTGPVSDTMTTDSNGFYEFTDLPAGSYTVTVSGTPLDNLQQTHDLDDPVTTNPVTPDTADVDLVLNATSDALVSRDDVDFGYREQGNITGTVTEDTDGDGAGDTPQAGVTVTLYEDSNSNGQFDAGEPQVGAPATTAADGSYSFTNVPAGDYVVVEDTPAGLSDVSDQDSTPDGDPFDGDTTVDDQVAVTIVPGETDTGNDFVDENQGSISGTVTEDTTGDGLGDTPQENVTVELYQDTDADGEPDGTAIDSTTTAGDGSYSFDNLSPGNYVVVEVQPADLEDVSDQDASPDGDPFDGDTTVDNEIASTVDPGENDTDNNFVDVDLGNITGTVTEDTDGDGVGDTPIQGVLVELFEDSNDNGLFDAGEPSVETTTTGADGSYSFNNLAPGDYVVVETQPANLVSVSDQDESPDGDPFDPVTTVDEQIGVRLTSGETDSDNNFVEENQGTISGSVLEDTNGDGVGDTPQVGVTVELFDDTNGNGVVDTGETVVDSTTTAADGSYLFENVSPGDYVVVPVQNPDLVDVLDQDQAPDGDVPQDDDITVDNSVGVGLEPGEDDTENNFVDENQGSISGFVLLDSNGDGAGDTPQSGVTVELYADTNGDGNPDGAAIDSTTTAGDGSYSFDPVSPGQYVVVELTPAGLTDVSDDDASPEDSSPADSGTPVDDQIPVTVQPGEADADNNFVDVDQGGITGNVSEDTTGDGNVDTPIPGVVIEWFVDSNADGQPDGAAIATTTTGADGNYSFPGVNPGNYVVVETQPAGLNSIFDEDQTPDGDPFDGDATVDNQIAVTVTSGELDDGNNFGEQAPANIEGQVLVDNDGDGTGDTGLGGVEITLQDSSGATVGSTTTAADGSYSFTDLAPGDYTVVETQPAGYTSVSDKDEQPDGDPQDSNTVVDDQIGVNLIPGETDAGNDFVEELPQTCPVIIDFDTDADGNNLAAGTIIDDEYQGFGITVTTNDPANHPAMIFNSSIPTGGDNDLGTPNQDFSGPGVGAGGAMGTPGENAIAEGNILIISEDGDTNDPDDNAAGGTLIVTFDTPYEVASVTTIDIESTTETYEIRAYDAGGALITTSTMQGLGNNSREVVSVDAQNVSRLEIETSGSGGVANIDIVCPDEPSIDIRKQEEGEDSRIFEPGATVDFEIAVTNTGAVDLINVEVSDPQVPACDNIIGNLAVGQTVTYTCSVVLDGGSSTSKTWFDDFSPAYSYSGNDGDTNFLGSWTENDPQGGGASSGRVLVGSNNKMWMNDYNYPGGSNFKPSVQRAVDLSDMQTATLSFDWVTHSGVDSNDAVALEVSTNGGSSFTEIDKFWGAQTSTKTESFDVSAYISSNTIFRFRVTNYYGGSNETFKVDNFKIEASGSDAPEGFVNIAYATGEADGVTVNDFDPSEVIVDEPVICECINGQTQVTLTITDWASNRDTSERIRVREGGLGGALLYDSNNDGNPDPSVPNGGSFTFDVNNPGTTIVVTVQGDFHPHEYVKGTFVTDCDLEIGNMSGNSYITFTVTDLVDDSSSNGDCTDPGDPGDPGDPPSGPSTTLVNKKSAQCLDNHDIDVNSDVYQEACNGSDYQQWEFRPVGNKYEIVNKDSNLCLDLEGSSQSNEANVMQYTCNQTSNQLWEVVPYGGYYQVKADHSGKCLEAGSNGQDSAYQYTCDGWAGQLWTLTPPQ